jgi:leucyl aminopeptidase
MDITDFTDFKDVSVGESNSDSEPRVRTPAISIRFPETPSLKSKIMPLLKQLSEDPMRENLVKFSGFFNRYYKSQYGKQSSEWLLQKVIDTANASRAYETPGVFSVTPFEHSWGQNSVIARIQGKTNRTVVIGAHQDSINMFSSDMRAPGADDDGSGSITILEALRVLLKDAGIRNGEAPNTIEFQWYSAEEVGLLGSQAVFSAYQKQGRDVRAMLQQDMTGYTKKTTSAGLPESMGVITDFVDPALTAFIQKVIKSYCDIQYTLTKCGYACSDHASARKAGYPSAFVIESDFKFTQDRIHTQYDTVDDIDFGHMKQHAKLTLGLAYELAFADLPKAGSED